MVVRDIYSLLEQYLADGFTFESLSKVSNVSVDIIERCYRKEKLTDEEILKSGKVLDKPSEYPNGFELSIKLLHLRNVLLQRRENDAT